MGLVLDKLRQLELGGGIGGSVDNESTTTTTSTTTTRHNGSRRRGRRYPALSYNSTGSKFPDLNAIPSELSLQILKHLNATDLCLASCVWQSLASDDLLWQSLCKNEWPYASIYKKIKIKESQDDREDHQEMKAATSSNKDYRRIFMQLDEATLTFNADWKKGLEYLFKERLIDQDPMEIAKFINFSRKLNANEKEKLFKENKQVLENVIILQNYENQFLPNALRDFFAKIQAPNERNSYLSELLEKFSKRFCACNPQLGLNEDTVYILCFSLILLSVDLNSQAVKNKMSKREFIKNTRNALPDLSPDFTGHLYDNIYLNGNVATKSRLDEELVVVR